jgi:thioredoxin reductase (NADPH)
MFPSLDDAAIDRMRHAGHERAFRAGEILFEQGEASTRFLVVLEGTIEVVHPGADGEHLITVHEARGFSGEISMLAGMPSLVRMRARSAGRVPELDRSALRGVISSDSELSDILMRAFILRRGELISRDQGDVVLLGSRSSRPGPI